MKHMVNHPILLFNFILFLLIVSIQCNENSFVANKETDTLFFLHVLFRHGERTTDRSAIYPNDPYANQLYLPYGIGQLTNEGKNTSYNIGATLRKMYGNFLGKNWSRDKMEATSTDFDRTKMTLQLVMAGLYPPKGINQWHPDMKWQPIPYNYVTAAQDLLLGNKRMTCPKYLQSYIESVTSTSTREINEENRKFYQFISENTGRNYTKPLDMYRLHFVLETEEEWGLNLLPWTQFVFPSRTRMGVINEYYLSTASAEMIRSTAGHLLKRIVDDTNSKINGNPAFKERRIHLYSAHEYNVGHMLRALKILFPHIPGYGSNIIWEVHRSEGQYSIRILYQGNKNEQHRLMQIPGCGEKCPIEKYTEILKEHFATIAETC